MTERFNTFAKSEVKRMPWFEPVRRRQFCLLAKNDLIAGQMYVTERLDRTNACLKSVLRLRVDKDQV